MEEKRLNVAVYGASGYAGLELCTLLNRHPHIEKVIAVGGKSAGKNLSQVYPTLSDFPLVSTDEINLAELDCGFFCLPHGNQPGSSMVEVAAWCREGKPVIDLSGDYRLKSQQDYRHWYGHAHAYPQYLNHFVYGLPEVHAEAISQAIWIANPGCYPTATTLGLAPLLSAAIPLSGVIVVDAKSGVSGAGRSPSLKSHFCEINENLVLYGTGTRHRHYPEIRQNLQGLTGNEFSLMFNVFLLPVQRGILASIYVTFPEVLEAERLWELYARYFAEKPFVKVLPLGDTATLRHVVNTNYCALSLHLDRKHLLIVACIDNLLKGAAGQAIQNMNLSFGFKETEGLL